MNDKKANEMPPAWTGEELPEREDLLTPNEALAYLGVKSHQTLVNWSEKGLLHPRYTLGGHRRYLRKEIAKIQKQRQKKKEDK